MKTQKFEIEINAPKEKVWKTMLDKETYEMWTDAFNPGSTYIGNWDEGSEIKFVGANDEKQGGMYSKIVKNIPGEYISIEHLGEIVDGEIDTTSERVAQWKGAHENYSFKEKDGVTTLTIELEGMDSNEEMAKMFEDMWPKALKKLKEISEK